MFTPFMTPAGMDEMSGTGAPPKSDLGTTLQLRELTGEIQRLRLLNQALWELLRERAGLTDADFIAKIKEVDLRDGVEDGKMTDTAVQCPKCQRVSNSKHGQCLYCGARFKQPVMR